MEAVTATRLPIVIKKILLRRSKKIKTRELGLEIKNSVSNPKKKKKKKGGR